MVKDYKRQSNSLAHPRYVSKHAHELNGQYSEQPGDCKEFSDIT